MSTEPPFSVRTMRSVCAVPGFRSVVEVNHGGLFRPKRLGTGEHYYLRGAVLETDEHGYVTASAEGPQGTRIETTVGRGDGIDHYTLQYAWERLVASWEGP